MITMQLIGHLGKDAAVNQVNGKSVINFTCAHSEKFTHNGEQKERTVWVDCSYWTDKTKVADYLNKGTQVWLEGTPEVRSYENKEGKTVSNLGLRVKSVQLLGTKSQNEALAGAGAMSFNGGENANIDENLPF